MSIKARTNIVWIVADLSPSANNCIANYLGSECDERMTEFVCVEGQPHKGYEVPDYAFIKNLRQIASRKKSGFRFTVFKKERERYTMFDFSELKKKGRK